MSCNGVSDLTVEQMEALPTRRLLAYKERLIKAGCQWRCDGERYGCPLNASCKYNDKVDNLKRILATREHVERRQA